MATVSPGPAGGGGGEEEEVCEANDLEGDDNNEEEDPDHETVAQLDAVGRQEYKLAEQAGLKHPTLAKHVKMSAPCIP